MKTFVLLALLLAGCATDSASLWRDAACHEQAEAWCDRAGYPTPGCNVWYVHECTASATTDTVSASAQDACMDAIATTPTPTIEPEPCRATWR